MHRFLSVLALLLYLNINGQIDQKKLDSLARSIDSSAKARKISQDSFIKIQDSAYQLEMNKALKQNSRKFDNSLTERKRKEAKERQQAILRIVISVVLFIIGIIALLRKRKTKT